MNHPKPNTVRSLLTALEAWEDMIRQRAQVQPAGMTPDERAAWERRTRKPLTVEEKH